MFAQLLSGSPVSGLVFAYHCLLPASWVTGVFELQFASVYASSAPIVLHLTVMMFSISISGMPNHACLFLGTTMKLHILCLLLHSNFTLHIPQLCYCCLVICFSLMFVFLVAANCSIVALGNNFFYMYNGTIFPSLPIST